ncbi:glycosyltransferase [Pacificimonas sp. ICDLI1SI03]
MKILYVVSTLKRSGPSNQLLNLATAVKAQNHEILVLTQSPESKDSLLDEFARRSIAVRSLHLTRWQWLFSGKRSLTAIVNAFGPDVVHTQGIRADVIAATQQLGRNVVATLRNVPFEDYVSRYGRIRGHIMAYIHLFALRRVKCVVLVSLAASRKLACQLPEAIIVPNGVDTRAFHPPSKEERAEAREALDLPPEAFVLISTGHLSALKDPMTVVEAFERATTNRNARLLIVGDGPLRSECEAAAGARVIFTGRQSDVRPYLRASDAFMSASTTEGMPNALMEALATGLPVCVSDIPPHRELLAPAQNAGEHFPVGNIEQAAAAICRIWERDHSTKVTASRYIAECFSADACAGNYIALYQKMLEAHASV